MKVIPIDTEIAAIKFSLDNQERTPGLHLSDILDDLEYTLFRDANYNYSWELEWSAALGFVWERVIKAHIVNALVETGELFSPGEIEYEGVLMTPDGYNVAENCLEEWKFTWKSSRRVLEEFHRYLWQVKAYCKALDFDTVNLRIMHVMGNYRGTGPQVRGLKIQFTERELKENWDMIRNYAVARGML